MGRTVRAQIAGPLAAYADGFGAELDRLGYSRFTVEAELQLMAHVSGWLEDRGFEAGQLTTARLQEYLAYRRACGHVHRFSPRGLAPLLVFLRGLGVASDATPSPVITASDRLLAEFEEHLLCVAGWRPEPWKATGGWPGCSWPPAACRRRMILGWDAWRPRTSVRSCSSSRRVVARGRWAM